MKKISLIKDQKGIAAIYLTLLILIVVFTMAVSISVLTYNEQKITQNIVKSNQAYYVAEAGLEDILLRISNNMNWSTNYDLVVDDNTAGIEVSDIIGGVRTMTSIGSASDRTRKIRTTYVISTQEISFYYGAQIGEGGMVMDNNTWVRGNVFSNGTVSSKVTGAGSIEESIIVAGNGNKIIGLNVGKDAKAFTCEDSVIGGSLTYVSVGGAVQNCTAGDLINEQPNEILPKDLPISQNQIDEWKQDAENGGVTIGDYIIPINETRDMGPQKIEGSLILNNGSVLNMTGVVWVTGSITINNGSLIKLDPNSYGANSGTIIADGTITAKPGIILRGSGSEGSYLLLLSTNPSLDFTNPAINIENNTDAAIFYANQGIITLSNNIRVREVTAYKVYLKNNTEIIYEAGLENSSFSSGPGGSWEIGSWKEIE